VQEIALSMHENQILLPFYRASDRLRKNLRNYAAFQGELCGKRRPILRQIMRFFQVYLNLVFLLGGIRKREKNRFSDSNRHLQREKCFLLTKKYKLQSYLEMGVSSFSRASFQSSSPPSNPCLVTKPYDRKSK